MLSFARFTILKVVAVAALSLWSANLLAIATTRIDNDKLAPEEYNKLGEATLKVMFWNIYDAALFSKENSFNPNQSYALRLTYLREFSKKQLIDATEKQLEKLDHQHDFSYEKLIMQLKHIWVDVSKGDAITFWVNDEGYGNFFHNGRFLGSINDTKLTRCFADIWLSPDTSEPKLRLQLLGVKQ